jgi:hypothetical protein
MLRVNRSLTLLDLSCNDLNSAAGAAIAEAVLVGSAPLLTLNLAHNRCVTCVPELLCGTSTYDDCTVLQCSAHSVMTLHIVSCYALLHVVCCANTTPDIVFTLRHTASMVHRMLECIAPCSLCRCGSLQQLKQDYAAVYSLCDTDMCMRMHCSLYDVLSFV